MSSLTDQNLWTLAEEYCRYSQAVGRSESYGLRIDVPFTQAAIELCDQKRVELEDEAYRLAGRSFNMNSPKQVGEIIGQVATNREALSICEHPVAQLINQSRQWQKAKTTYFLPFLEGIDANEIYHPEMHLTRTVSGRMAMKLFNLLPRGNDIYNVRGAVIPRNGYALVDCDLSQIELRLLAHFSQDSNLLNAYNNGIDVHQQTADLLGIPRQVAKRVNFSVVYGAGDKGLVNSLRMEGIWLRRLLPEMGSQAVKKAEWMGQTLWRNKTGARWEDASDDEKETYIELGASKNILNDYKKRFPMVEAYIQRTTDFAQKHRYIETWTGRKRRYPQLYSKEQNRWYNESRTAPNNQIQSGANEVLRIAYTNLDRKFQQLEAEGESVPKIILAVHDSLVLEAKNDENLSYWIDMILWHMEHTAKFSIPIIADCKVGYRWSELSKWERK